MGDFNEHVGILGKETNRNRKLVIELMETCELEYGSANEESHGAYKPRSGGRLLDLMFRPVFGLSPW